MPERFVRIYRGDQLVQEIPINAGDEVTGLKEEGTDHFIVQVHSEGQPTALESIDASIAASQAEPEPEPEPAPKPAPKTQAKKSTAKKSTARSKK